MWPWGAGYRPAGWHPDSSSPLPVPAVFYYAGHGYEHLGRNYMVPVDAPQPYAPENCISVQRILQKMQQQQTALNIILLDTCRKW